MLLSIHHRTHYRFTHPARYTVQYLRLTPRSDSSQNVLRWSIGAPGGTTQQTDAFGNILHILVCDGIHEDITITVEGLVDSADTTGIVDHHPGEDRVPREIYLRPTELTRPDEPVCDLAAPLAPAFAGDRLDALHQLSRAVAQAVDYRKGETNVTSTAAQALAAGFGVCQDQAHVFAAAARLLGAPTRYVSGYVHSAGDGADEAASHAWAESWIDDLGWVAFDVANEVCANDAHVRLAVGPDYLSCAPVRGVRRGGGEEDLSVQVTVAAAQQ